MIAETRTKLITHARQSFATLGYADTSMDVLCAEAGLTRGALYHHFGGKEGLLEAVVVQIDREIEDRLVAEFQAITDPWEAFTTCCRTYLDLALDPEIQRILLKDAPAVLGQRFRELDSHSSIQPMIESLHDLMASSRLRPADPEAIARLLNGAMVDAALWVASSHNPAETLAKAQQGLALLLAGLEARP
jgi:AcrR family transcriptional regulator